MRSDRFLNKLVKSTVAPLALMAAALSSSALADYDDALAAYGRQNNGQIDQAKVAEAVDMWQKYAVAGDILSRQTLGDIYAHEKIYIADGVAREFKVPVPSATGVVQESKVEALAWYTIAATHDFDGYNQTPDFRMINAKTYAADQVTKLKALMSTKAVEEAQQRVVDILASGSDYDLYRLGVMYQTGEGLPKNNVEALKFYRLATGRVRFSNSNAALTATSLVGLMTREEIAEAERLRLAWQPPLPETYFGKSPREQEIARQQRILENRELGLAVARIEQEFGSDNEFLIQGALAALGLYLGEIDGKKGDQTRASIEEFQFNLASDDPALSQQERRDKVTGELTPAQKVALIEQAAKVNHPMSQYILGVMYAEGIGKSVDGSQAVKWLERSSSYGYPLAHYALGNYYRSGIFGNNPVGQSRSKASYHYGQAVALGYKPAEAELKKFYKFSAETVDSPK